MTEWLFLLFLLACPVGMFFMMRGGHGDHGRASSSDDSELSVVQLRRRRGELDRLIDERERGSVDAGDATSVCPADPGNERADTGTQTGR